MNEQEYYRRVDQLVTRMNRMEAMVQQLLLILTSSGADGERTMQMQTILQELRSDPHVHPVGMAGINPGAGTPQERPEIRAIRQELLSGNKMKAILLYRSLYGVGLKEAQDALDAM
jgi:ribosomal protein L7/L12